MIDRINYNYRKYLGVSINIQILFQNHELVVVDKPHGLSVHNNEDPINLLSILDKQLKVEKLYPIHRLDKETSGIQIFALNQAAARKLSDEFQEKTVKKIYIGILRGQLKESKGQWNKKLTDKAEGRTNPQGMSADRVPCETKFTVIRSSKFFTYCEFDLITGRQHQIRKHTALINHSLVGDSRYGDKSYNKKMANLYKTERMFLHCLKVEILGMTFESRVPDEFEHLFKL